MIKRLYLNKILLLSLLFLALGILYRVHLTWDNNFLFNIDNARDFVDVREMVVLGKLRLTGPTSAIEGVYNGPAWYYLLAVPFIISGGHPYGAIVMEIILWAIGGFFLFKLTAGYGFLSLIFVGILWVYSNYIVLATLYSFNPNPVTLLTPLFVYLLVKFLESKKIIFGILVWFLGGLFFHFEMNFGVFIPPIIFLAVIFSKNIPLLKSKNFWIGAGVFSLTLLPQIIFDLRHEFIMTNSLLRYLVQTTAPTEQITNPLLRLPLIFKIFYNIFLPTFLNFEFLAKIFLSLSIIILAKHFSRKNLSKDLNLLTSLLIIFVPFIGYVLMPITVNPWHLGAEATAFIILSGIVISALTEIKWFGKILALLLCSFLIIFIINDFTIHFKSLDQKSVDVSNFVNELQAVDYVFEQAQGKNFKVYAYLPSIIDYPYQYLFWWRGLTKYNYTPKDYAYLPNMPSYISNKERLPTGKNPPDSGLIFLIKEDDRRGERHLWENNFAQYPLLEALKVGPIEIEIRQDMRH